MSVIEPRMRGDGFLSQSVDETREMGARLARALPAGTVVALVGELGAGKTTLVQGAAEGLGVCARTPEETCGAVGRADGPVRPGDGCEEDVISPTFVLLREHATADGRRLLHVDAHRLSGAAELVELGSDDFLGPASRDGDSQVVVAFVEWADVVYDALPQPWLAIRMSHESETVRRVQLGGLGPGHEAMVELAARALGVDPGGSAERTKGGRE